MGVKKAMNMALEASESSVDQTYTLGPLVHNNDAVNMLKKKNVYPATEPDALKGEKVFIRAHGVPPTVKDDLEKRGNSVIDATCPYVKRVQNITREYAEQGYNIVISGDPGHAEVEGLLGYCPGKGYVVTGASGVRDLPDFEKICVIAQTTQSKENFTELIEALKKRYDEVVVKNTICGATTVRQKEVLKLAEIVDFVVVVGGKHSANTKRLEELSLSLGTPTILIENASQLDEENIRRYSHVGVTAGASTPSWVIDDVVNRIESIRVGALASFTHSAINAAHFFIDSSMFLALGAVALYYTIAYFLDVMAFEEPRIPILIYLFINSVHFLNSYYIDRVKRAKEEKTLFSFDSISFLVAVSFLITSIILAAELGVVIFVTHMILCTGGVLYRKIKFTKRVAKAIKFKSLKDIPASRDLFQSLAWSIIIVGYPAIHSQISFDRPKIWIAASIVFSIVFARSIVYDMKDIRLDKLIGKDTLPMLLGDKNTKICLFTLLGTLMAGLFSIKALWPEYYKINIFLLALLYMVVYLYLYHKKIVHKGYLLNLVIDGQFFFAGLMTWLFFV